MKRALCLLVMLAGCATYHVPPCTGASQPGQRFACSQLPVCKYNCAATIVITEGGTAPQTVAPTVTQSREGAHVGGTETGPVP